MPHRIVEAAVLLRVADQHRAFVGLPDRLQRQREKPRNALEHDDLALIGSHGRGESDHRRESSVAEPRGEHDFGGDDVPPSVSSTKPSPRGVIRATR